MKGDFNILWMNVLMSLLRHRFYHANLYKKHANHKIDPLTFLSPVTPKVYIYIRNVKSILEFDNHQELTKRIILYNIQRDLNLITLARSVSVSPFSKSLWVPSLEPA